jgi:hypothetical protein
VLALVKSKLGGRQPSSIMATSKMNPFDQSSKFLKYALGEIVRSGSVNIHGIGLGAGLIKLSGIGQLEQNECLHRSADIM